MSAVASDLSRFRDAQAQRHGGFADALRELRAGRKTSHWIWYVFPQLKGLGMSSTSMYYGIGSLAEAKAYLAHPELGPRLKECVRLLLDAPGSAADILGPDDVKLRSSLTLFVAADPDEPLFAAALERFFDGVLDDRTLKMLA
jgi:uncharacterized protein (DUF1810 family)